MSTDCLKGLTGGLAPPITRKYAEPVRLVDLDHDMSDVIPTGSSVDSEFLFQRMEDTTLDALRAGSGARLLDSAAGIGQDDRRLARAGLWTVGAEPSKRMMALAKMQDAEQRAEHGGAVLRVRAWSEARVAA